MAFSVSKEEINPEFIYKKKQKKQKQINPTLIGQFESLSVLRVVTVEVDDGQVGGAQQRGWDL